MASNRKRPLTASFSRALARVLACATLAALLILLAPALAGAQVTVSGQVTAGDEPVSGATVGIPELGIETRTGSDGRYNFLVRSAQVRGQTVRIIARHRRFGEASVQTQLIGGSMIYNFALGTAQAPQAPQPPRDTGRAPRVVPPPAQPGTAPAATRAALPPATATQLGAAGLRSVDSTAFAHVTGPQDLGSALAGRFAGLLVTSSALTRGSAPMIHRGPRSLAAGSQPLVVVDGVVVDNVGTASASQVFGLGGIDYGTPLDDIALDDIASVMLLDGASATLAYGARAANGVLLVTTKRGTGVGGFQISTRYRFAGDNPILLPAYQNSYGQGLNGQFEFFDGRGGGINDAIEESWGPRLDGTPIAQFSFTEPRRPDVRYWLPNRNGVRDYFADSRSHSLGVALEGASQRTGVRLSLDVNDATGLTPNATSNRLSAALTGFTQNTQSLEARANVRVVQSKAEQRPGTGFDEINPVAGFTRFGRQVNLAALRANIRDTAEQINWIYTARNNPYFAALENTNDDDRTHILASTDIGYRVTPWLTATLRGGATDYTEKRNISVADGWKGGYPTALGRGNFGGGGTQNQTVEGQESVADLSFAATSARAIGTLGARVGVETRSSRHSVVTAIADRATSGPPAPGSASESGSIQATSVHVSGSLARSDYLLIHAGARLEDNSSFRDDLGSAVFPALTITYDAARTMTALRENLRLGAARLRASWWRAGNEVGRRTLAGVYAGAGTPTSPLVGVAGTQTLPERTTGVEVGAQLASVTDDFGLDLTWYRERSTELLVATSVGAGTLAAQSGEVFNSGVEVAVRALPLVTGAGPAGGDGITWRVGATFAKNTNTVDKLAGGLSEVALGPSIWGSTLVARIGYPLGTIVGKRHLRDASTNALILRNGLPIPDDTAGLRVLGSWQPDWSSSVTSTLRFAGMELGILVDARMGGRIFSATNRWGSYAGTLEVTVPKREDGLLIAGVDSATGSANGTTVSVQDYFHALGAIHEAFVYDASYAKLREARLTYDLPLSFVPGFRQQIARLSVIGRNVATWTKAPNIDPETALSVGVFQGYEMGQLPTTRSIGIQISVAP